MADAREPKAEEQMSINDTVIIRDVPVGAKVRLRSKAIAEVTANPQDGGWLFIKFVEFPDNPGRVGEEDMVFCTDVLAVV